jgi:hypothetical protein
LRAGNTCTLIRSLVWWMTSKLHLAHFIYHSRRGVPSQQKIYYPTYEGLICGYEHRLEYIRIYFLQYGWQWSIVFGNRRDFNSNNGRFARVKLVILAHHNKFLFCVRNPWSWHRAVWHVLPLIEACCLLFHMSAEVSNSNEHDLVAGQPQFESKDCHPQMKIRVISIILFENCFCRNGTLKFYVDRLNRSWECTFCTLQLRDSIRKSRTISSTSNF